MVIKSSKSLDEFKCKIRQWKPDCACNMCKAYLQYVGFIHISPSFTLREKCPYSEFLASLFSRIRTEYGETVFGPSAEKYGAEKL